MGFRAKPVRRGDPVAAGRWNEHEAELERLGRARTGPGLVARSGPGGTYIGLDLPELVWVKLTGPAGADAGYPYTLEYHLPPLQVTSGGNNYTTATATVSGGGGTGATVALTVDPDTKTVSRAKLTAVGINYTGNPTVAVSGDGSGATVQFNAGFTDAPVSGDGLTDAAYDVNGSRSVPNDDGTVYPAVRAATTGRLVFFGGANGGFRLMVVTSAVGKRVGAVVGTGQARNATFNAGTGALAASTDPAADVKNMHTDKGFKLGAYIAVMPWYKALWAFDVDSCANLS